MQIGFCERQIANFLSRAGVESPGFCAKRLLQFVVDKQGVDYLLYREKELAPAELVQIASLVQRRANGEPLAYILGSWGFYENEFIVSPATLIPRPETEQLVELALQLCKKDFIFFADLGCGCGCIGLSLLIKRPSWYGLLLEREAAAIQVAYKNANHLVPRAQCLLGDIFSLPLARESLDLVISNPPYIAYSEKKDVMDETLAWEPHSALFSESGGLAHLQAVMIEAYRILRSGGWVIVEHGWRQGNEVAGLMRKAGFAACSSYKDLAGLDRCCVGQKL